MIRSAARRGYSQRCRWRTCMFLRSIDRRLSGRPGGSGLPRSPMRDALVAWLAWGAASAFAPECRVPEAGLLEVVSEAEFRELV